MMRTKGRVHIAIVEFSLPLLRSKESVKENDTKRESDLVVLVPISHEIDFIANVNLDLKQIRALDTFRP